MKISQHPWLRISLLQYPSNHFPDQAEVSSPQVQGGSSIILSSIIFSSLTILNATFHGCCYQSYNQPQIHSLFTSSRSDRTALLVSLSSTCVTRFRNSYKEYGLQLPCNIQFHHMETIHLHVFYIRLGELAVKKHSQKSGFAFSLRIHRRTSCLEYRGSVMGLFPGTASGIPTSDLPQRSKIPLATTYILWRLSSLT